VTAPFRLLLASASPRRADLLRQAGLDPEIRPADLDEAVRPGELARDYARRVAEEKARAVLAFAADRPLLAADTVVHVDDGRRILGKPGSPREAREMLTLLSGRRHLVVTAYHLIFGANERARAIETEVELRPLLDEEIAAYVRSREWEGKAGGYAVQGLAAAFVRAIHGSYTNVVGLPLCEVLEDLRALGALPATWALGEPAS
jgi:septum formation protein